MALKGTGQTTRDRKMRRPWTSERQRSLNLSIQNLWFCRAILGMGPNTRGGEHTPSGPTVFSHNKLQFVGYPLSAEMKSRFAT